MALSGPRRGGTLLDSAAMTGPDGAAGVHGRAGADGDSLIVLASIAAQRGASVRFAAAAIAGPDVARVTPADVASGDTLTVIGTRLGPGTAVGIGGALAPVVASVGDTLVRAIVPPCLDAGAVAVQAVAGGAASRPIEVTHRSRRVSLSLAPMSYETIPASRLSECIELVGAGASYLVAAQFAAAPPGGSQPAHEWRLAATVAAAGEAAPSFVAGARDADGDADRTTAGSFASRAYSRAASIMPAAIAFDRRLRALEAELAPFAASQAAVRASAAGEPVAPPPAGSLREFNVVSRTNGAEFSRVTARLRYVGERVLVYTDTAGDTHDVQQLFALAALMDRHLVSTAVGAFGPLTDVDGDGRVTVLFTPVVNALVRAGDCVPRGYVTGFFYPPDVLERAAHSNRSEVFYALVPDPEARYSCAHTQADVVRLIQAAFMHELQHLISFNAHVLVRGGAIEETWLNEGLSQMAEELGSRLFEMRYPPPLGRTSLAQLYPDSAAPFIAPQLLNAYLYLFTALDHSVTGYDGVGSLEERGATWLYLKWLAGLKGDAILRRLVQTRQTGVANLEAAVGEAFAATFGDFSLMLFVDSLPGVSRQAVPARLRMPDRSIRQLMARQAVIAGFPRAFPLETYALAPGGALRSAMLAGTMIHTIVETMPSQQRIRLAFTTPTLAPFGSALGAQVSVFRLPP